MSEALKGFITQVDRGFAPLDYTPAPHEESAALDIARIFFGGVQKDTPQWQKCLAAARAISRNPDVDLSDARYKNISGAFQQCTAFNKTNPSSTAGTIDRGDGQRVPCRVEMPAMVFPHPKKGEVVAAFFSEVGWRSIDSFRQETKTITPAEELSQLAMQAMNARKPEMADALLRAAITADPKCWQALNQLGVNCSSRQENYEAISYYTEALVANPNCGEILNNRAMTLRYLGNTEAAVADCRAAMRLLPANDMIALNAASALDDAGEVDECLKIIDEYMFRNPAKPDIHYNRALILLSAGRLQQGWDEFKWRLQLPSVNSHFDHFDIPTWDGGPIDGKHILILPEQGLGDEIMTASMIIDAAARAGSVTMLCSERLLPLFRRSFPNVTFDLRTTAPAIETFPRQKMAPEYLPAVVRDYKFDVQMSQGDLGKLFRNDMAAFPSQRRFLSASVDKIVQIEALTSGVKNYVVGISWHSQMNPRVGALKSVKLTDLLPILKTPGVTFVNLQYGDNDKEIADLKSATGIDIVSVFGVDQMKDIDGYAALVASMDLVITVSNTTAHVAGGLGVPTWVITPTGPGKLWYWFRDRTDSPWYPSITLFRQPQTNSWSQPIESVATKLREMLTK